MRHTAAADNAWMKGLAISMLAVLSLTFALRGSQSRQDRAEIDYSSIEKKMKEAFDNGDLQQVIDLYRQNCLKEEGRIQPAVEKRKFKHTNKKIRADIYQWVALAYIALDQPEKATGCTKRLLVIQRGELPDKDWLPLRNIADRYRVGPRWSAGVKIGLDFTTAHPSQRYSLLQPVGTGGETPYQKEYIFHLYYSMGPQVASVIVEYALDKKLSLSLQPSLVNQDFLYENNLKWEKGEGGQPLTKKFRHIQFLDYLEIPLLLKCQFPRTKLKPYVQIGGFCQFLLSAVKTIEIDSPHTGEERVEKAANIERLLKKYNIGIWIGAGFGFKTGLENLRMELEVNYKHGLSNIVDTHHRYENRELLYGYYDVFDDMKLRSWNISLKILLPLSYKAFRR